MDIDILLNDLQEGCYNEEKEVIELTRKLFKLCEIDTLEKLREIVKLSGE